MFRIAITGPESTGKSLLAKQLADHYHTFYVPEISREYLDKLGRKYVFEDIALIAKEQFALENIIAAKAKGYLFCDTEFIVTKIWSHYKYGKCDPWIEEMALTHRYDLYLLCNIDIPWEEDPLREHPNNRNELFEIYCKELVNLKADFRIISGKGKSRLKNAILAVEETFGIGHKVVIR